MTEIEKRKRTDLTNDDQANPFESYGEAATASAINGDLLKFNRGDWQTGQQAEDIPLGTRLHAHMDTLRVGFQLWRDNAPVPGETHMGLVVENYQPPKRSELGYLDEDEWERDAEGRARDPYAFTNQVVMVGEDGRVFTYVTSSRGGLSAVGELCKAHGSHIRQHPGDDPLIELAVGSYQHRDKAIGRVKFPVLKVVGWVAKDDPGSPVTETPPVSAPPHKAAAKPGAKKPTAAQPQF